MLCLDDGRGFDATPEIRSPVLSPLVVVVGLGLISLLQIPTNRRAPDGEPISVDLLQLELSLPTCADPQSRTTEHFSTRKLRQGLAEAEHYTVQDGEQIILQSGLPPLRCSLARRSLYSAPSVLSRRSEPSFVYRRLPQCDQQRWLSETKPTTPTPPASPSLSSTVPSTPGFTTPSSDSSSSRARKRESAKGKFNLYGDDWEDTVDFAIQSFDQLPHRLFGANQHMIINYELKEALRLMLRQFNAPIVYCFAYGSGVFPQEDASKPITEAEFRAVHPKPPDALVKSQKGSPR
uniref:Phosphatidate cytidylyltransferase n=1 Tax=Bionectria ochroleuca TaxID=29856 RepID=A0A8H7KEJ5_BIOOC